MRVGVKKLTAPSPQPPTQTPAHVKLSQTQPNPTQPFLGLIKQPKPFLFSNVSRGLRCEICEILDSRLKGLMRFEVQGSRIAIFEMWDLRLGMWGALKKCVRWERDSRCEMRKGEIRGSRFDIWDARCEVWDSMLDVGCWMLDVGRCSMFDIRYLRIRDVICEMRNVQCEMWNMRF